MISNIIVKILTNKLLVAILIVAALLRFVGTKPGYNQFHADEGITYSAATSMIKNGNLDPLRYDYPTLVPLINFVLFKFIFVPVSWAKFYLTHVVDIIDGVIHIPIAPLEAKKIFQVFVLGERERNALFWGRYVTALFSLGNVFLTYVLGKKLFSKGVGLIAAALLTFNFKHVINSHIGLPDIYNAFFVLLAFITAFNVWKKPSLKNYLIAGIVAGLSFSVKYQIFAIFPLAVVHFYISFEKGRFGPRLLFNKNIFMAFLCVPLVFILINPYHMVFMERTIEIVKNVSQKYGMGVKKLNLYPFSYFYHIDYGPVEFVLVFLGLITALKKFTKQILLLLSFVIPFMFMMVYYSGGGFYVRNFITTTPIFLIFVAVFLWWVYIVLEKMSGQKIALFTLLALLIAAVFVPGRNAVINSYYYTKAWGYDIMRPWVQNNLPTDVTVATHPFDAVNLKLKNKRTEFEVAGAFSMAEHRENGASYLILDLKWVGIPFYFWLSYGFEDLALYWNKPLDIMRNTFHGIATEEFFRYQVYAVTKPWQAPDTHLIIVKFPDWERPEMFLIKSFDFDQDLDGWTTYWGGRGESSYIHDLSEGRSAKGAIAFIPGGTQFPTVRLTSQPVAVKGGHLYKIEGFIKTQVELKSREREGFIRLDFYKDNLDPKRVGMISAVSSRVYGTDDWAKKEIIDRAPDGAKYLTVSFQTYVTTRSKIWLDDVSIYESKDKVENVSSSAPYVIRKIDLNYVYPNSHGNL